MKNEGLPVVVIEVDESEEITVAVKADCGSKNTKKEKLIELAEMQAANK